MNDILFYINYAITLIFGVWLSATYCDIRFTKKNHFLLLGLCAFCGSLQLLCLFLWGEAKTWELYPLITHLPLLLFLIFKYKKRFVTALASITLAYLCCQPSLWVGLLIESLTDIGEIVWIGRILTTIAVGYIIILKLNKYIYRILNLDKRTVMIFAAVPVVFYVYDYIVNVYTNIWASHTLLVSEFLSTSLCVSFMGFCIAYYRQQTKRNIAEQKEQIFQVTVQQQERELFAIKQSDLETKLLRHDMRLLLSNLAMCIENDDKEASLKLINGYIKNVDAAKVQRYCKNDTINYILTNFDSRFKADNINFSAIVEIDDLTVDELAFSSIVSNALDNAYNALAQMDIEDRQVKLMLKESGGKLLLSIKNTIKVAPIFVDGMPVTTKTGHGYGTQSIRYLTEKLGGIYQFSVQDEMFVVRVMV